MSPVVARNVVVGAPALALAGSGGLTVLISNDVGYDPARGFRIDPPRLAQLMDESGGALLPASAAVLKAHTVASYTLLAAKKWDRAWHWFEIPNNENFYYMRLQAPILAWLPVTFWLLAPAALVGLTLSARQFPTLWPLYLLVGASVVPLVVFYTLGRFRVPLAAAVIPFAAFTLIEVLRSAARRSYARVGAIIGATVLLGGWTGRPLTKQTIIPSQYWLAPFYIRYEQEVRAAQEANDPARAAAAYLGFFRYEPDLFQVATPEDAEVMQVLAGMHGQCATLLRAAGQRPQAELQTEKARGLLRQLLSMNPANHDARVLFADTLFDDGSFQAAAASYKEYLDARPDDARARLRRAAALLASDSPEEALPDLERAAILDPENAQVQWYLTALAMVRGDLAAAEKYASRWILRLTVMAAATYLADAHAGQRRSTGSWWPRSRPSETQC